MESFHQIMIQHLLGSANVFKYNWLEFWIDFSKLDDENQFTGEEYRSEMVNQILPKIHTYDLSDEQQRYLMLLRHDMFLNETEEGFTVIVPKNYADKIKIILNRLTSKVSFTLRYFIVFTFSSRKRSNSSTGKTLTISRNDPTCCCGSLWCLNAMN